MVTMGQWTGRDAGFLRQALRLTVRDFAEDLGVSPRTISKWESAGAARTPRPELQAALDTALAQATDEERERFEEIRRPESSVPGAVAPPGGVVDLREPEPVLTDQGTVCLPLVVDGQTVLAPLDARVVASIGLGALLGRTAPPQPAPVMTALTSQERERLAIAQQNPRRYFDAAAVATLRRQLDACKADDQAMGPAGTLPGVLSLLTFIDEQARDVTPEIRCLLLSLGARGAEFAGWLYRDLHDLPRAERWYDRATAWAQEAGDLPMQGYILLKKSQMAYDERDVLRVVTLGRAAWEGPWQMPAKVRAEACQQSARGMAMTGSSLDAVRRRLDEAHAVLQRITDDADEAAHLATHYSSAQLRLQTASCYLEAGQALMAADLYGEVLASDGLEARDRGYFLARRAHSLALAGQPDDASAIGLDAYRLADATRSARTRRELNRASQVLTPWHNRPGPRALREALAG